MSQRKPPPERSSGERLLDERGEPRLKAAGSASAAPRANVAAQVQQRYTVGARRLASQSVTGLARTRVTPNALTVSGVSLCIAGSVVVWFEYRSALLFYWLGAALFLVGSILDILDGALARAGGKTTPFGAFLDSTTDRVGEGFMLGAIALVFARHDLDWAIALAFASVAGSFLVSYTRAKAEILGLKGDVGIGGRAERVVVLVGGLVFAPWGGLQWAIVFLTALTWFTVGQRVWAVRGQMLQRP
ncbi:MAG TPA: CDP-alcohol phosphatidyltransferase family protein [Gaiellaceae bacterium]|nr:CDP-alcohol phosphatidyltransferase family protein [Gaiellaceae bacterium]